MLQSTVNMRKYEIRKSISRARAIAIVFVTLSVIGLFKTASTVVPQSSPIETQHGTEASNSTVHASEAPGYNATTGAISVRVLDFNTSAPISGATVSVWRKGGVTGSPDYNENTDSTGHANISYVPPGEYTLRIVADPTDYPTKWAQVNVTAQQIYHITMYLEHWSPAQLGQSGQSSFSSAQAVVIIVAFLCALIAVMVWGSWPNAQDSITHSITTPDSENDELQTARANTCRHCGSDIVVPGSVFCWNCGVSLEPGEQAAVTPVKIKGKAFGKNCMVCQLELSSGDEIVYCPHCGNPAHRDHLLEWLHIRGICPACSQHLDERELRTKTSKRKLPRHGTKSPK